jgi:hypothetical protein
VSVGRRAALDTLLDGANAAGLMVRLHDSEMGARRAPKNARRSMAVDDVLTDILL